jgi:hypothetical protein
VNRDTRKGLVKCDYRVGFRLYTETFPDYKDYSKFWPNKNLCIDSFQRTYLGDIETMDETISYYSKRLQPFKSCTMNQDDSSAENYLQDDLIEYYNTDNNDSKKKIKNLSSIIVGRANQFNFYYAMLLKNFAENSGYDQLLEKADKAVNNLDKENSVDLIQLVFQLFELSINYFHKLFLIELTEKLMKIGKDLLNAVNSTGVKSVKKDTLDVISRVLKTFNSRISKLFPSKTLEKQEDGIEEEIIKKIGKDYWEIEKLLLTCSLKLIKSGSLDKRIQSIKSLVEYLRNCKDNKEKLEKAFVQIKENNIFEEIFGSNSHSQLIIKSQDLIGVMLKENKLGFEELSLIWNYAKKADYEGKLTILKILKDMSRHMNSESIKSLLSKIYLKSEDSENLINEEVEVS